MCAHCSMPMQHHGSCNNLQMSSTCRHMIPVCACDSIHIFSMGSIRIYMEDVINIRCYTLVHGFCFFRLFLMGTKELINHFPFLHHSACHGSPGTSQPLRPQYEYMVDHSGGQSRYRCALKVTMDGCPETITGGYHATSTSATQEAERKLTARTFLEGLYSRGSTGSDCNHKSKLEQYFKLKGLARPKIHYKTRDHRGYQSTVTAPGMGAVKGDCCRTRAAAEQSAALHMLRKIQKYADE